MFFSTKCQRTILQELNLNPNIEIIPTVPLSHWRLSHSGGISFLIHSKQYPYSNFQVGLLEQRIEIDPANFDIFLNLSLWGRHNPKGYAIL